MLVIPTRAVPSQVVQFVSDGFTYRIRLSQKSTGLFADLAMEDYILTAGALCLTSNFLIRTTYLTKRCDFAFFDKLAGQPAANAAFADDYICFEGLGDRYFLGFYA